jgi:hypothetical protein
MATLRDQFAALTPVQRRVVHDLLADHALAKWNAYARSQGPISYVETVCGTRQMVDASLPGDALASVRSGQGIAEVALRYGEPITAMQDGDLSFRESAEFAYYAVYNFFRRYALQKDVEDWLLVNQALSSDEDEGESDSVLKKALRAARRRA